MSIAQELREMARDYSPGGEMHKSGLQDGRETKSIVVALAAASALGLAEAVEQCDDPELTKLFLDAYSEALSLGIEYNQRASESYPIGLPVTLEMILKAIGYQDPKSQARLLLSGKRGLMNFYRGWTSEFNGHGSKRKRKVFDSAALLDALQKRETINQRERELIEEELRGG